MKISTIMMMMVALLAVVGECKKAKNSVLHEYTFKTADLLKKSSSRSRSKGSSRETPGFVAFARMCMPLEVDRAGSSAAVAIRDRPYCRMMMKLHRQRTLQLIRARARPNMTPLQSIAAMMKGEAAAQASLNKKLRTTRRRRRPKRGQKRKPKGRRHQQRKRPKRGRKRKPKGRRHQQRKRYRLPRFTENPLWTAEATDGEDPFVHSWPDGVVQYHILTPPASTEYSDADIEAVRLRIEQAMHQWERRTCIRFRPVGAPGPNDLHIRLCTHCTPSTAVWRDPPTMNISVFVFVGVIEHELGHALHMGHTTIRSDASEHIALTLDALDPVVPKIIGAVNEYVRGLQADKTVDADQLRGLDNDARAIEMCIDDVEETYAFEDADRGVAKMIACVAFTPVPPANAEWCVAKSMALRRILHDGWRAQLLNIDTQWTQPPVIRGEGWQADAPGTRYDFGSIMHYGQTQRQGDYANAPAYPEKLVPSHPSYKVVPGEAGSLPCLADDGGPCFLRLYQNDDSTDAYNIPDGVRDERGSVKKVAIQSGQIHRPSMQDYKIINTRYQCYPNARRRCEGDNRRLVRRRLQDGSGDTMTLCIRLGDADQFCYTDDECAGALKCHDYRCTAGAAGAAAAAGESSGSSSAWVLSDYGSDSADKGGASASDRLGAVDSRVKPSSRHKRRPSSASSSEFTFGSVSGSGSGGAVRRKSPHKRRPSKPSSSEFTLSSVSGSGSGGAVRRKSPHKRRPSRESSSEFTLSTSDDGALPPPKIIITPHTRKGGRSSSYTPSSTSST